MKAADKPLSNLRAFLDSRLVRLLLAIAIIVSVLPYEAQIERLRIGFLVLFGAELALRLAVVSRDPDRGRSDWAFLFVDVLALVSFLPLETYFDVSVLRALRILRLLALIRFTRELAADLYSVLTRREQLQQLGLVTAAVLALSFVAAAVLYHLGVPHEYNDDGSASFWDRMWWSFRQVESPDNLIPDLHTSPMVALVSLGLTITGIFVFSYLIGVGTNIVEQVLRAERRRPVRYRNHTVVVGAVHESELLVREFVRIYDKNRALRRIGPREIWGWLFQGEPRPRRHALPRMALLGPIPEAPPFLYEKGMRWVVYRDGDGADPDDLQLVSASEAKRVVLLAPHTDTEHADAVTLARLSALRAHNPDAHVFLEITESDNEDIATGIGGEGTFVLDVPQFLGLFLCHHVVVPGIEDLFDELLSAKGGEFYTHLFVDPSEHRSLGRLASAGQISFGTLAKLAHQRFGVTLVGVFLASETPRRSASELIPVDRFQPWVNPTASPNEQDLESELNPGWIPLDQLRGLFGIADTYIPMRRLGRATLDGSVLDPKQISDEPPETKLDPVAQRVLNSVNVSAMGTRDIWIVGFHNAVPPLVQALAHFVHGVRIHLVVHGRGSRRAELLQVLGIDDTPGGQLQQELDREGHLTVHLRESDDLAEYAAAQAADAQLDVIIFLPGRVGLDKQAATDVDALNTLRVLRFVRRAPATQSTRILVELNALHRGEELERHVRTFAGERFDLTVVSTEQIRNYFMVHSAFVPGATKLYERLLGHRGQELVYLPVKAQAQGKLRFADLIDAFATRCTIPIAVRTKSGLTVNPTPKVVFEAGEVEGLFAISDLDQLTETFK